MCCSTPLTVSPPLKEGQRISEWEPKFRASVISIDENAAVRLLPLMLLEVRLKKAWY